MSTSSPCPYFGDVWESAHGADALAGHRLRFLSSWTGIDLSLSQVVDFPLFPWHTADWNSSAFHLDSAVLQEFLLEPIASTGA